MCVTLRLITIKFQIVTQNHWTSFLRNAIKVSFGWNFRIPLTPDQLPSWDHGGSTFTSRENIIFINNREPVTSRSILPVLVFFRIVRVYWNVPASRAVPKYLQPLMGVLCLLHYQWLPGISVRETWEIPPAINVTERRESSGEQRCHHPGPGAAGARPGEGGRWRGEGQVQHPW